MGLQVLRVKAVVGSPSHIGDVPCSSIRIECKFNSLLVVIYFDVTDVKGLANGFPLDVDFGPKE